MMNKFNIEVLHSNFNILRKIKHLSKAEFCKMIGVANAFRTDYSSIGPKMLKGITDNYPMVDQNWLLTPHDVNYDVKYLTVCEPLAPYPEKPSESVQPSNSLLNLTAEVLDSDSVYRDALESNVKAFHEAVSSRKRLAVTEAVLTQCQRELAKHKNVLLAQNQRMEMQDIMIAELRDKVSALEAEKTDAKSV